MKNEININTTKENQNINLEDYDMVTIQFIKQHRTLNIYLSKTNIPQPKPESTPTPASEPTPTPAPTSTLAPILTPTPTSVHNTSRPLNVLNNIAVGQLLILYDAYINKHIPLKMIGNSIRVSSTTVKKWFDTITKFANNFPNTQGHPKLQIVGDMYAKRSK
jgi:hypothetical protein